MTEWNARYIIIIGDPIVREFNIVYLKYADLQEKIDAFFPPC